MKELLFFAKKIHSYSGKKLYLNLIGMILSSVFEGIGILLLIPLLSSIGIMHTNTKISFPLSTIFAFIQEIPESISLCIILLIYIGLIIGQSFFQRSQTILNAKIQQNFTRYLREETYINLLQANWNFYLQKRKTDLINIMTTEIYRVSGGVGLFLQLLSSIIFTLIQIAIAMWLSLGMTSFILGCGLILLYFSKRLIKTSQSLGKETVEISKTYLAGISDHLNGMKDIKSNTLEKSHLTWFFALSEKMESNIINLVKLTTKSNLIYKVSSAVLIALFLFFSVKLFRTQSAQLLLIIAIFSRLWPRISEIQSLLQQVNSNIPSFKSLLQLRSESLGAKEVDILDQSTKEPLLIEKAIVFNQVNFRYNKNEESFALQNINLHIPVNRMTAVVGPSGAGKSTLIDILLGLNRPHNGEIMIDNKVLTKGNFLLLRNSISYIPQDPFLFNTTVRENLLLVNPHATEEQIWKALDFAVCSDFIQKLPQGLDTVIGDRGIRLSGGERQRLVLARAILRNKPILILDEATSALDTENEAKIQRAIDNLKGSMTIIIIAHRLSTIRNADQVVVLENGKIIQIGGFQQLANDKRGMFNSLLKNQVVMQGMQ